MYRWKNRAPISLTQFNKANCTGLSGKYQGTHNPYRVSVSEKTHPVNNTTGFTTKRICVTCYY